MKELGISLKVNCLSLSDLVTVKVPVTDVYENDDCNDYGIPVSLIDQIENNFEALGTDFVFTLDMLGEIGRVPFWIILGLHMFSMLVIVSVAVKIK